MTAARGKAPAWRRLKLRDDIAIASVAGAITLSLIAGGMAGIANSAMKLRPVQVITGAIHSSRSADYTPFFAHIGRQVGTDR